MSSCLLLENSRPKGLPGIMVYPKLTSDCLISLSSLSCVIVLPYISLNPLVMFAYL